MFGRGRCRRFMSLRRSMTFLDPILVVVTTLTATARVWATQCVRLDAQRVCEGPAIGRIFS